MNRITGLQRVLFVSAVPRKALGTVGSPCLRRYATSPLPNVYSKSFWTNLVPTPLRRRITRQNFKKNLQSKEWNPATFFIFIFLLIGSMSIQMIALKRDFDAFSRRTDAKIGLLREIVERIQNGEEIDVEGLLGTGDRQREEEWEQVIREIEKDDEAWDHSKQVKPDVGDKTDHKSTEQIPKLSVTEIAGSFRTISDPKAKPPSGFY